MNAQKEAERIYVSFRHELGTSKTAVEQAKRCALLCVDEMIKTCDMFAELEGTTYGLGGFHEEVKEHLKQI